MTLDLDHKREILVNAAALMIAVKLLEKISGKSGDSWEAEIIDRATEMVEKMMPEQVEGEISAIERARDQELEDGFVRLGGAATA